jgi:hypothetical protein
VLTSTSRTVGSVERLVVARVEAQSLAADDLPRRKQIGDFGIVDDPPDLAPDEVGREVVGPLVDGGIGERAHEGKPSDPPPGLVLGLALLRIDLERGLGVPRPSRPERAGHGPVAGAEPVVVGLDRRELSGIEGPVVGGDGVARGALEDRQLARLLGDDGDGLDRRGAGADDPHPLAGEVDLLAGPATGVEDGPLEIGDALDGRDVRRREAAGRHDEVLGGDVVVAVGGDPPPAVRLVEDRLGHPRLEPDVGAETETLGDVPRIAENLRLAGVALRPGPLLLELVRESVRVLHALDVAAGTRVAVPVPRPADVVARLEDHGAQPGPPQAMEHVHAPESGAHDDGIERSPLRRSPIVSHVPPSVLPRHRCARRLGGD